MKKITIKDYNDAINSVLEFEKNLPKNLKPEIIIQNGHINDPGISDIDIIFVFKDDFLYCSYFLELFQKYILQIENYNIFFHHLPHILPLSSLKDLPHMSFNPSGDLNILKGDFNFSKKETGHYQNILNSFEQIHSRIVGLAKLYLTNTKNLNALLLNGHSIIHSLNSVNQMGYKLNIKDFKTFIEIENLRKIIVDNADYKIKNYNDLRLGLIDEFYLLLKHINKKIENKVLMHFSKNQNIHKYDHDIYLVNLNKKKDKINFHLKNKSIFIEGFSWQTLCLFENYFLEKDNFQTVFKDLEFENEIKNRLKYLKQIFIFNFNNFSNPVGRNLFHPLVKGPYLTSLSRKMIL